MVETWVMLELDRLGQLWTTCARIGWSSIERVISVENLKTAVKWENNKIKEREPRLLKTLKNIDSNSSSTELLIEALHAYVNISLLFLSEAEQKFVTPGAPLCDLRMRERFPRGQYQKISKSIKNFKKSKHIVYIALSSSSCTITTRRTWEKGREWISSG